MVADRSALTTKLQRTLMQVQIRKQEQTASPPGSHQAAPLPSPPAAACEDGAFSNFGGAPSECSSLSGPGAALEELTPTFSHLAAGSKRSSALLRAQMQTVQLHPYVPCALDSKNGYSQEDTGGSLQLDSRSSRKRRFYLPENSFDAKFHDLELTRSDSCATDGSSSSSACSTENPVNTEAGQVQFAISLQNDGRTCWERNATMTHAGQCCSDMGPSWHRFMLPDPLDLEVIDRGNAAVVEGLISGSGLGFSTMPASQVPIPSQGLEYSSNWMPLRFTAPSPQTLGFGMPGCDEQVVFSSSPPVVTERISHAEVDNWMASLASNWESWNHVHGSE